MDINVLLDIRGDEEVIDTARKNALIIDEIDILKNRIKNITTEDTIDIHSVAHSCKERFEKTDDLNEEIKAFHEDIIESDIVGSILNTTRELQKIVVDLEETDFGLAILEQLVECDEQLKNYYHLKDKKNLHGCVAALSTVTELLNSPVEGLDQLTIYKALKTDLVSQWETLLNDLSSIWSQSVFWTHINEKKGNSVTITIDSKNLSENTDLMKALILSKQMYIEIEKFAKSLFRFVLVPIIQSEVSIEKNSDTENVLSITVISNNSKRKPHYEVVLSNLKFVFEYLFTSLPYQMPEGGNWLKIIGSIICVDFSDLLIKDCLVQTIPNCISELQDYGSVTSQVEIFQKYLTSIHFFESENFSILLYTNNVDVLFANKTSQYFLESARNIMKKDLGNIMSVGTDLASPDTIQKNDNVKDNQKTDVETFKAFKEAFKVSPFIFPRCAISRSTQELLDLMMVMMEQASEASDMCARRLFYTARNVIQLYMAILPLHFKVPFETNPQQIALFHNNTMFLSHNLLTFGAKWQSHLASKNQDYTITFCDLVKELRDLAAENLLQHMRLQKKQILDTIRSSDLYYIATKDSLSENAEQSVRQCIRQLQLLKTVWIGIFPKDIYRRLITNLANVLVEELISKVLIQEDITAKVAAQLSDIYKIVLNRLPEIYQDKFEIMDNVPSFLKFGELIMVLNGSLSTIEERWFDGSGPLTMHFKPDELKRLIRALFQNTTFRANLLSKIK